MNRILTFLMFLSLSFSVTSAIVIYKLVNEKQSDIIKLNKKFGTPPKNPKLEPVVHLADKNGRSFCTAFVIDANYAVTAGHCLDGEGVLSKEKLKFLDAQGNDLGVEVTAAGFHEISDFGLLTGDFNNFMVVRPDFYNFAFIPNKMLLTCGYPYGQNGTATCNPFLTQDNENFKMRGKGYLIKGMSGGPVFDPQTGFVVGINYAVGDGHVYVSPLQGFLGVFGL